MKPTHDFAAALLRAEQEGRVTYGSGKKKTPSPAITEKEFQAAVIALAKRCGWVHYHTHDSRRSVAGFPDLILLRERLVVVELKRSAKEKPTPAQEQWLASFRAAGVDARLWTPELWSEIEETLR